HMHVQDDSSACLAAVAFMLGGPIIVWLEYPPFLSTMCWAGLLLYLLERLLRERRPRFAALAGLVAGLSLLGGQGQYASYLAFLVTTYVLVRIGWLARGSRGTATKAAGLTILA